MKLTDFSKCDTYLDKGFDNNTLCDGGLDCWQRNHTELKIHECKKCDCYYCEKRQCRKIK